MPRCEDYPCCGHEKCPGHDEDGEEIWYCCDCGCELPKGATSSLCTSCMRSVIDEMEYTDFGTPICD